MGSFLLKILGVSLGLSLAIKYGGPFVPISGTMATVLIAVLAPALLVAIALGWRWQHPR